jgi:hypothetical protein
MVKKTRRFEFSDFSSKFRTIFFPQLSLKLKRSAANMAKRAAKRTDNFMSHKTMSVCVYDVLQFIPQIARISQDYRVEMLIIYMHLYGEKGMKFGLKICSFIMTMYSLPSAFLLAVWKKEIPN